MSNCNNADCCPFWALVLFTIVALIFGIVVGSSTTSNGYRSVEIDSFGQVNKYVLTFKEMKKVKEFQKQIVLERVELDE